MRATLEMPLAERDDALASVSALLKTRLRNSSKSELLYGAHHARAVAKTGVAIVVEGYIDALAMHQAGMVNTVALMGTSITEHQIAKLTKLASTAVLMLDGDDAGAGAVMRAGVLAGPLGLDVLVATLPAGARSCRPAATRGRHGRTRARG